MTDPAEHGWWLASRAAGIVALLCITLSVGVGLAMAGRVSSRPRLAQALMAVHQQTALVGLVAIAVHGITLLGDRFMDPGLAGIAVPFVIDHEPAYTGVGIIGGWLAAILGLSYWIRNRIGARAWRKLHRATILVYVLSVVHTLGAGTDASSAWMQTLLVATGAPIVFLFLMRILPRPATGPAFRRFRVAEVTPESAAVTSFALEPSDGKPLAPFEPGQFVTVRLDVPGSGRLTRSYSLSAGADPRRHRISVKREGACSGHLHAAVEPGDVLELAGPSGTFVLDRASSRPVALVSAGVGATPVLAMLHALAEARSPRAVWWVHGARNGSEHPFREEVRELVGRLPNGRLHVIYSRPEPRDVPGRDHHAEGRVDAAALAAIGVPRDAEHYLCGPAAFLDDLTAGLREAGVPDELLRSERFGPAAPRTPARTSGPAAVAFSRSGVSATWDGSCPNLLDLAEANGVPAAAGCRIGSCHSCRTQVLDGSVRHDPEPLEPPPDGSALLCCAHPEGDVVLDA
jgi:ferredoxin-NADP reductase/ferredoxin/DMSO/TMAO reductase YedYZ heme-binding membrane subunit